MCVGFLSPSFVAALLYDELASVLFSFWVGASKRAWIDGMDGRHKMYFFFFLFDYPFVLAISYHYYWKHVSLVGDNMLYDIESKGSSTCVMRVRRHSSCTYLQPGVLHRSAAHDTSRVGILNS